MLYNRDHTVMQYCNGTNWISMDASRTGGSDNLGNHTATKDLDMATFKIKNAAVPTASADVPNKAYVDAAVAAAAGGSGGGSGGGSTFTIWGSNTCPGNSVELYRGDVRFPFGAYYGTIGGAGDAICVQGASTINTGNSNYSSYWYSGNGAGYSAQNLTCAVCMAGGGSTSITDDSPAPFNFPDSPNTVGTGAYTWAPVQIIDFDMASVQISVSPGIGTAEYRVCSDANCANVIKAWRSSSTGITNGNYLQIRINAAATRNVILKDITVTVGAISDTAKVRGGAYGMFVTSQSYTANLGGVAGADAKCQTLASGQGFPGTWRAWISGSAASSAPATRFENAGTSSPFVLVSNAIFATSWANFGSISNPPRLTETGADIGSEYIFTNTMSTGNMSNASYSCGDWNSTTSSSTYVGHSNQTSGNWTSYTTVSCSNSYRLYCFQTVH